MRATLTRTMVLCLSLTAAGGIIERADASPVLAIGTTSFSDTDVDGRGCALQGNQLYCWGGNAVNDLDLSAPVLHSVAEFTPRPDTASGEFSAVRDLIVRDRSCIVDEGGTWCWGRNERAQLGLGDQEVRTQPARVPGLPADIAQVAFGAFHACARSLEQGVWCWGGNEEGETGYPPGPYGFNPGANQDIHLPQLLPKRVPGLPDHTEALALGDGASCALSAGQVWCWGRNDRGQLGDGGLESRPQPALVSGLPPGIVELAAGANHVCAIEQSGRLWCWGDNHGAQAGAVASTSLLTAPVPVGGLHGPASGLHLGYALSCTRDAGIKKCWGITEAGTRLGPTAQAVATPPEAPADWLHGCFEVTGQLRCSEQANRYPNGPLDASRVPGLQGALAELSLGRDFACARAANSSVWCWGSNDRGQLGQGDHDARDAAVRLELPPALAIAAGTAHACAATVDGVWCWGANSSGQLGDGSSVDRSAPVRAAFAGNLVATGHDFSCAADTGALNCWGGNAVGQVSGQAGGSLLAGAQPLGQALVSEIRAGFQYACAVIALADGNGEVRCWGNLPVSQADLNGIVNYGPRLLSSAVGLPLDAQPRLRTTAFTTCLGDRCYGLNYAPPDRGTNVVDQLLVLPPEHARDFTIGGRLVCAQGAGSSVLCAGLTNRACRFENAAFFFFTPGQFISCTFSESMLAPFEREWLPISGLPGSPSLLTAGEQYACAIVGDGAWCWGRTVPLRTTDTTRYSPVYRSGAVEPGGDIAITLDAQRACPAYLLSSIELADPDAPQSSGGWGQEILLAGGNLYLQGGLNFGGYGSDVGNGAPGYAAFSIANAHAVAQQVDLKLGGDGGLFDVRLYSVVAPSTELVEVYREQLTLTQFALERSLTLPNGYHLLTLQPRQGTELFLAEVATRQLDGSPAYFQGGAVVGGYLSGAQTGFSAICTDDAAGVRMRTEARSSRGASGAGDLHLRLLDGLTGEVIYDSGQ